MKKPFLLMLLAVFLLVFTGCESSTIQELTPEEKAQMTCDAFAERYNAFIGEMNDTDYFSMKTITKLTPEHHSFKPADWCSFDLHFDEDGTLSSVILGVEGAAAAKLDEPFMTMIGIMSAIACGIDPDLTEAQRQDLAGKILNNFFDVLSLDAVYETQINSFNYSFYVKFGYITMRCSPV